MVSNLTLIVLVIFVPLQFSSVICDCETWIECVGSFFNNFSDIVRSNDSVNLSTKFDDSLKNKSFINIVNLENSEEIDKVYTDLEILIGNATKNYRNNTKSNILTFDFSQALNGKSNNTVRNGTLKNNVVLENRAHESDNSTVKNSKTDKVLNVMESKINNTHKDVPENITTLNSNIVDDTNLKSSNNNKTTLINNTSEANLQNDTIKSNLNLAQLNEKNKPVKKQQQNVTNLETLTIDNLKRKDNISVKNITDHDTHKPILNYTHVFKNYNINYGDKVDINNENIASELKKIIEDSIKNEIDNVKRLDSFVLGFPNLLNGSVDITVNNITINNQVNEIVNYSYIFETTGVNLKNNTNIINQNTYLLSPLNENNNDIVSSVTIGDTLIKTINDTFTLDDLVVDYYEDEDEDEDNSTDYPIIDYAELYKDTTNELVVYVPTERNELQNSENDIKKYNVLNISVVSISADQEIDNFVADSSMVIENNVTVNREIMPEKYIKECPEGVWQNDQSSPHPVDDVFSWVVAIYARVLPDDYTYVCDGALLTSISVLTAAQCVTSNGAQLNPEDLLLVTGKRSLQGIDLNEKAFMVHSVHVHNDFAYNDGLAANDLAIVFTKDAVEYTPKIKPFCFSENITETFAEEITTEWKNEEQGALKPISLRKTDCKSKNNYTFCATYADGSSGCPSFGGLYAVRATAITGWSLTGIQSGDVGRRSTYCTGTNFTYTSIANYYNWITDNIA